MIRTRGVKVVDPVAETVQIDWLVVPASQCRDAAAEHRVVCTYFRRPHEPWGPQRAFVMPVKVRRGRGRILFRQESGLA